MFHPPKQPKQCHRNSEGLPILETKQFPSKETLLAIHDKQWGHCAAIRNIALVANVLWFNQYIYTCQNKNIYSLLWWWKEIFFFGNDINIRNCFGKLPFIGQKPQYLLYFLSSSLCFCITACSWFWYSVSMFFSRSTTIKITSPIQPLTSFYVPYSFDR